MQRCHHSSSAPRALSIIPRTAALPILAALLLVGVIVWRLGHTENLLHTEAAEACSSLPGRAGQLCSSYYTAIGPDKFTAAVHWRKLSSDTCKWTCPDTDPWYEQFWGESLLTCCQRTCKRLPCDCCACCGDMTQSCSHCDGSSSIYNWLNGMTPRISTPCEDEVLLNFSTNTCPSLALAIHADACSGITVECLQDDMHSSTRGSSCYPVQDGDACDGEEEEEQQKQQRRTCKQGFCGGEIPMPGACC